MAGKIAVGIAWIFGLASVAGAGVPAASFGTALFWILLAAHALECLVFLPTLRRAPGSLAGHLARTLLFGVLHYQEVRARADARDAAA